jgi:hypothetical protein
MVFCYNGGLKNVWLINIYYNFIFILLKTLNLWGFFFNLFFQTPTTKTITTKRKTQVFENIFICKCILFDKISN